jgi:hypothetical protein
VLSACGGGSGSGGAGTPSDGTSSPAPAPAPAATVGSIKLSWVIPQTNLDGSPLTNLAGFKISYGTASGIYSQTITINSATMTSYTIENLTPARYYIVLKAFNANNLEGPPSAEGSKLIE